MDAYCEKMGKAPGSVRFMFDGNRVNVNMTAEQVTIVNIFLIPSNVFVCS
jgi:hypothetical protein